MDGFRLKIFTQKIEKANCFMFIGRNVSVQESSAGSLRNQITMLGVSRKKTGHHTLANQSSAAHQGIYRPVFLWNFRILILHN